MDYAYKILSVFGQMNPKNGPFMRLRFRLLLLSLGILPCLLAQVPSLVNYQSSIAIGGTNYQGVGYFKFALVSAQGFETFWSNDGTGTAGGEPERALPLAVDNGAYEVILGDASLPSMRPVPPSVFANPAVHLRVWFSPDNQVFQQVEPDVPITATGYSMMAANVADGAVSAAKLAEGAVTAGKLGPKAVTAANLAPGAAAQNLQASGGLVLSDQGNATNLVQAGFAKIGKLLVESDQWTTFNSSLPAARTEALAAWTGSQLIVWGGRDQRNNWWVGDGARYNPSTETWTAITPVPDWPASAGAKGVWIGFELLVLSDLPNQHRRYYPAADTWRTVSSTNAPKDVRTSGAILLWTGAEALVWHPVSGGKRWDPARDLWSSMAKSTLAAVGSGSDYAGAWTGTEMIVWGSGGGVGARYNPATDTWRTISKVNAPAGRYRHTAICAGPEVIFWGGQSAPGAGATLRPGGGIYNPTTDTWMPISTNNVLGRSQHFAVWTGTKMLVWGGTDLTIPNGLSRGAAYLDGGAIYTPKTDSWSGMASSQAPSRRQSHLAVWTGTEMIVWGGVGPTTGQDYGALATGARYNPVLNTWSPMSGGASGPTGIVAGVWADRALIAYNGANGIGGRYEPSFDRWEPISRGGPRYSQSVANAAWTGNEMLVWGGPGSVVGARYNPITDAWAAMTPLGAPKLSVTPPGVWAGGGLLLFSGVRQSNVMTSATFQYTLTKPVYLYQHP